MRLPEPSRLSEESHEAMRALQAALTQAADLERIAEAAMRKASSPPPPPPPPPPSPARLGGGVLRLGFATPIHQHVVSPRMLALGIAAVVVAILLVTAVASIACRKDAKRWRKKASRLGSSIASSFDDEPGMCALGSSSGEISASTAAIVPERAPRQLDVDGELVLELVLEQTLAASDALASASRAARSAPATALPPPPSTPSACSPSSSSSSSSSSSYYSARIKAPSHTPAEELQTRKLARHLPRLASMVCSRWAPAGLAQRARQAKRGREAYAARQQRAAALAGIAGLGV
jgi:hypothetical protein